MKSASVVSGNVATLNLIMSDPRCDKSYIFIKSWWESQMIIITKCMHTNSSNTQSAQHKVFFHLSRYS